MAVTDDRPAGRPRAVRTAEPASPADGGRGLDVASPFDRQPPQDLTAEQSVLGGMLLSKDAIADVVEVLRPDDFYRPAHQTVYDTILDLYGRGEPADAVTVAAELARRGDLIRLGGAPYLHTLIATVPTAANAAYYAEIVAEKAILRRLVEAGTRIVQLGYHGADGGEVAAVVDRAQAAIYDVTERSTSEDFVALEDLLQPTMDEIDAIASRGGMALGVPTGFADLDAATNGLHPGQMIVVAARPGLGKALALDTPLPTPTGWTTMGAVRVGDELLGHDGCPTRVVAATEVMVGRPCYEVEFSDGTVIVADAAHQWATTTRASRKQAAEDADAGPDGYLSKRPTPVHPRRALLQVLYTQVTRPRGIGQKERHDDVTTTEGIYHSLRCPHGRLNHAVATASPLDLPHQDDLLVPPYTLGVWLGDGTTAAAHYTSTDPEIALHIEGEGLRVTRRGLRYVLQLPAPDPVAERPCAVCGRPFVPRTSQVRTCGRSCGGRMRRGSAPVPPRQCRGCGGPSSGFRQCQSCRNRNGTVSGRLRTLGVLGNKHIPAVYLRASVAQRRALLAGLLDTDGTVTSAGTVQFSVTSERLASDTRELIASLGYRCSVTTKRVKGRPETSSTAYTLNFSAEDVVFRLGRKQTTHKERRRTSGTARTGSRYVTDVRPVPSVPVRCVQVDNASHLYLASRSMVPTHNSTLGLDFARSASVHHGLTSVVFSLEMSRSEIVMRLLSAEARIRLADMRAGRMSDDDWTRMARRMSEISEAPLFIDDSPNLTLMEIRAKARRLKQRHDLKLVILDYLQLMTSGRKVESRQQEVSEFSRQIKLLAKELEVPVVAISQLNRGPEQRTDKRPMLSDLRESGCLTRETTLLRADSGAPVTFGTLLDQGHDGVLVWSLDEQRRLVPAPVTNVFPSGVKDTYRLTLASGRTVTATGNHQFLAFNGWVALDDLAVGDRIAAPRRVPEPITAGLGWSEHRIGLLAHLIGDGCVVRSQPVHYTSGDENNLAFVDEAAAAEFGITPRRVTQSTCQRTYLPAPWRCTHGRKNPVHVWLAELGIEDLRSYEKRIPDALYGASDKEVRTFLHHLWATDGCIFIPRESSKWQDHKNGQCRIYYSTSSRALADGVAVLLSRLAIPTRLHRVTYPNSGRSGWHLTVAGSSGMTRFCSEVGAYGKRGRFAEEYLRRPPTATNTNVDTLPREVWELVKVERKRAGLSERQFQAAIGTHYCGSSLYRSCPSRERVLRCADATNSDRIGQVASDDVFWDKVVSIEPCGPLPVYDATVKGTHNFIANGVVAHNSIEQDADMVILLHRPDAFERDDPRAGEADLILAKHRNGPTSTITVAHQLHYSRFADLAHG